MKTEMKDKDGGGIYEVSDVERLSEGEDDELGVSEVMWLGLGHELSDGDDAEKDSIVTMTSV
jgi:hypothetical protein